MKHAMFGLYTSSICATFGEPQGFDFVGGLAVWTLLHRIPAIRENSKHHPSVTMSSVWPKPVTGYTLQVRTQPVRSQFTISPQDVYQLDPKTHQFAPKIR